MGDAKGLSGKMCSSTPLQFKQTWNISILERSRPNPKEREQVAPRYRLTMAISCGHLFLSPFPIPFAIAFLYTLCWFNKIQNHLSMISTAYIPNLPFSIAYRGTLGLKPNDTYSLLTKKPARFAISYCYLFTKLL